MSTQKTKTDNGKSRAQLVKEARDVAQKAGGTLAEAILRHIERTADQLRYEDIAAVTKRVDSTRKDISSLTTAHAGLSRKQGEVEKAQKTTGEKVGQLKKDTKQTVDELRGKVTSISDGLKGVRTKTEENAGKIDGNATKIERLESALGRKLTEDEVKLVISDALETNNKFRDRSLEEKFVTRKEAEEGLATKGEITQVNDGYITIRDTVNEALEVAKDAYTTAVEAQSMAEGANTQANGAFSKADEVSSDVHDIRTSMAPEPPKESSEMPEEVRSAPDAVTVTKTEVQEMIKGAARKVTISILAKIADFANYAESPHDLAEYIQEEIKSMGDEE